MRLHILLIDHFVAFLHTAIVERRQFIDRTAAERLSYEIDRLNTNMCTDSPAPLHPAAPP